MDCCPRWPTASCCTGRFVAENSSALERGALEVCAVVLAHGPEPHLADCVGALLDSRDVRVNVVVVDNDADPEMLASVADRPGVSVIRPGRNTGFAGGANLGASHCHSPVLAFINSDAVVEPDCLAELAHALQAPGVGLACASLRLASDPELVNSVGNPVHFLYFSWVGGYGEPARAHSHPKAVASVTGATFAVRRETWLQLGGFDEQYFLYGEDVDLSIRTWQAGLDVMFVPSAVSVHHYDFHRTSRKYYYLERNRLINLLTLPGDRTLRRVMPMAVAMEGAIIVRSLLGGSLPEKAQGYKWLLANRNYLRQRRAKLQAQRVRGDAQLNEMLVGRLDIPPGFGIRAPQLADRALAATWRWASKPSRRPNRKAGTK